VAALFNKLPWFHVDAEEACMESSGTNRRVQDVRSCRGAMAFIERERLGGRKMRITRIIAD
jgi:hypothetical protein